MFSILTFKHEAACLPVKEEISFLVGAATQRLTDDVTVPERRGISGKTHTVIYEEDHLFYGIVGL